MSNPELKKEILDSLKAKGLDVAEEALAEVVEGLFEVAETLIVKSENKFDDMALVVLPKLKELTLKALDKLDGEDDEGR